MGNPLLKQSPRCRLQIGKWGPIANGTVAFAGLVASVRVCFGRDENWRSFGKAICSTPGGLCFSFGLKFGLGRGSEGHGGQSSF